MIVENFVAQYKEPVPLMGRSAILGEQRNNDFVDVACGRGEMADSTYAITKTGLLCEFNNRRLLDKWVELRVSTVACVRLSRILCLRLLRDPRKPARNPRDIIIREIHLNAFLTRKY